MSTEIDNFLIRFCLFPTQIDVLYPPCSIVPDIASDVSWLRPKTLIPFARFGMRPMVHDRFSLDVGGGLCTCALISHKSYMIILSDIQYVVYILPSSRMLSCASDIETRVRNHSQAFFALFLFASTSAHMI